MKRLTLLLIFSLAIPGIGCAIALVPSERTVIFPAVKAAELICTVCYNKPDITGYWTPTETDLEGVEDTLLAYLHSQKADDQKDWREYRRQVVGVKRGDELLLFISYFHFVRDIEEDLTARKVHGFESDSWKKYPYGVCDGGSCFFRVLYDLRKKQFIWYESNGVA